MVFRAIFTHGSKAALLLGFLVFAIPAVAFAQDAAASADPKTTYKNSLSALSSLYQNEVDKLEKRHQQSNALYQDGLISRVDLENGEKALADARAKLEQVARDIEAANKPVPVVTPGGDAALIAASGPWTTGNAKIDNLIRYYSGQHGVDPFLVYCLMSQESSFNSKAMSYKGAQGLMQLMPDTAARYGVTNPYDVAQNIMGGTRYLRDLLKMFNGRVDLALAGYNAGEGAVMKFGNTIPPYSETRNYVKLILQRYGKKI